MSHSSDHPALGSWALQEERANEPQIHVTIVHLYIVYLSVMLLQYDCLQIVYDNIMVYSLPYRFILYVEAAANGMFGAGRDGLINPPDMGKQFPLAMAEIAVLDQAVYDLIMDTTVLYDMSKVHRLLTSSLRVQSEYESIQ